MTDKTVNLPVKEIQGVQFPDYGKITMDEWAEMIERAMDEAESIWSNAKQSKQINLSTTFTALERSHAAVIKVLGPFSLLVDGGYPQAGEVYEKATGRLAQSRVRQLSDPEFASRCQQALAQLGKDWPAHQVRAAEQWLLQMRLTGSLLQDKDSRDRLGVLAGRSAELESQFQQMISDSCNGMIIFSEEELDGVDVSQLIPGEGEHEGKYGVRMIREPVDLVLEKCKVRNTREKVFEVFEGRGTNRDLMGVDTAKVIDEILSLRTQRASILGFENFAELKLAETMASTPQAAGDILQRTWEAVSPSIEQAMSRIEVLAKEDGVDDLAAWDTAFYMKKLEKPGVETETGATLAQTRQAMFKLANRLFGLTFEPVEVSYPWKGMAGWLVKREGKTVGGMLTDFMAREGKPSGAWMHLLFEGYKLGKGQLPLVANTCNFGGDGDEAVLSAMDVRTAFHEFGHALHGLLGRTHLPSACGTNTLHDWVELPSQLLENWAVDKECARELGLPEGAGGQNGGLTDQFQKARYLQSAMLDLAIHSEGLGQEDLAGFEKKILTQMGADERITPWHRLPHFSHLFSGDMYSAGYYAYLWAEALDADVFQRVKKEDPMSRNTGSRLERYIYASGDEQDPAELFEALMGRTPDPEAVVRRLGVEAKPHRPGMRA